MVGTQAKKMLSACFPKYIALKKGYSYKLYSNTILQSEETANTPSNIFEPMVNLRIDYVSKYSASKEVNLAYVRKWYGGLYNGCTWSYAGYELSVHVTATGSMLLVPVVVITRCCNDFLPHGADSVEPVCPNLRSLEPSMSNVYESATLVTADPFMPDSTIPIAPVADAPHAQGALDAPRPAVQVLGHVDAPVSVIPVHVKRLIIADSVQRGEVCPISTEQLTLDNACTTTCGHVFSTASIQMWLKLPSSKSCCPVCKQKCSVA